MKGTQDPFLAIRRCNTRVPLSDCVPRDLQEDFSEAVNVLPVSPKASAALSRRVLQHLLSKQGYDQRSLNLQIKAVLDEEDHKKVLPLSVATIIRAVQEFGNFAAHPTKDASAEIINVEEGEADWCLEIIESLFEHYYIKPAETEKKLTALSGKRSNTRR